MTFAIRARYVFACLVLCGLLGTMAACDTSAKRTPSPTPTAAASPSATAGTAVPDVYHVLPFATSPQFLPAPNGQRIAASNAPKTQITLLTLDGSQHGHFTAPSGVLVYTSWLADSSGLLIWTTPSNGPVYAAGPAYILESSGALTSLGTLGFVAIPAPDSSLLAAARQSGNQFSLVVEPRHGGHTTVLAQASDLELLGWLGRQVVYAHAGAVWTIPASGGGASKVGNLPNTPPGPNQSTLINPDAPDGSVVVLTYEHNPPSIVTAAGVAPMPRAVEMGTPAYWVGPHSALGTTADGSHLVTVDLQTGQAVATHLANQAGTILAISGSWILWSLVSNAHLELSNYQSGVVRDLGLPPNGDKAFAAALAQGRFLLWDDQHAYLLDANAL